MGHLSRGVASASAALVLLVASSTAALGAVQVVELSAQQVVPGMVVTMRVAMTARIAGTEPGRLFMIPSGTWGDSPEELHCEEVGGAIDVGQTTWQPGTVQYEGVTYDGVEGESTFTVPQVPEDTYRLAETIDSRGTGCHIFTTLQVVAELPNTAMAPSGQHVAPQAAALAITLATLATCLLFRVARRIVIVSVDGDRL